MACVIPNLDFEYELRGLGPGRRGGALAKNLARQIERWQAILRLEPGFGEASLLPWPEPWPEPPAARGPLLAWGVTPTVLERVGPALADRLADSAVVRWANAKGTSHDLEGRLGVALPHACRIASVAELERAVAQCPHPWVAKHPFGVSGRERLLGEAGALSDDGRRWATKVLAEGVELVFEPWVDKAVEWSVQFDVAPDGAVTELGSCRLHAGPRGQFAGHSVGDGFDDDAAPAGIVEPARQAVEALAAGGYHGPVGVDAFEGTLGDRPVVRPVCELNARVSFGRLALRLAAHVPAARFTWRHPTAAEAREAAARGDIPTTPVDEAVGPGTYRLPDFADPQGRSGTFVLIEG